MNELDATPLYIDCDTGIDDALALAYLLAEPRVDIVGIGTVSGNVPAERAAANTLALLEAAGRTDIPVSVGEHHPLRGAFAGGAPHVHGADGVGGIGLEPNVGCTETRTAVELMAELADQYEGRLRILALGPLTNLARFATERTHKIGQVSRVIVMGGAFAHPGNVTAVAEANIHNDPEAAQAVFDALWNLDLLPLDLTMRHPLTEAHARAIARTRGLIPAYLGGMLASYLDFYANVYGLRQCALHDPLAAIIAADTLDVVLADEPERIRVLTDGAHRGRTVADEIPTAREVPRSRRRVVQRVSGGAAEVLIERISEHDWPDDRC